MKAISPIDVQVFTEVKAMHFFLSHEIFSLDTNFSGGKFEAMQ